MLYLLFEHQSTPDPWMPLRLLGYKKDIWARQFHDLVLWPEEPRTRQLLEAQQPKLDYARQGLLARGWGIAWTRPS